ncbi:MAG: glycosyltransferase [archaeon]
MISIIITTNREPKTVGKAIKNIIFGLKDFELLVCAPDNQTLNAAKKSYGKTILIRDLGKGKPAALNLAFARARGKILILTDGDVYSEKGAAKKLLDYMNRTRYSAVSGRVVSLNERNGIFGYWAHLLTNGFHNLRLRQTKKNQDIICSGYLYALRAGIVKVIPEKVLADDAYISLSTIKEGFKTGYCPEARVFVKYPDNLPDWIRQKKRTAGRVYQLEKEFGVKKSSSLNDEIISGFAELFEIDSFKELAWFILLMIMRGYIWARVFLDFRLWRRDFGKVWERVESTK